MILGAGIDVMAAAQDPGSSPAGELQAMLTDRSSGEPLGFAACLLTSADTGREYGTVTTADGRRYRSGPMPLKYYIWDGCMCSTEFVCQLK